MTSEERANERSVDADQVRAEHLADVSAGPQWAYLFAVLVGGALAMLGLIALLGALGG